MEKSRLSEIAKQYLVFDQGLGEAQLIRRIQQARGERSCFATAEARTCQQTDCWWRDDCLRKFRESEEP